MNQRSDDNHSQTVLLTGVAGGMGTATAKHFVARGWRVIGLDHNRERLSALAAEMPVESFVPLSNELAAEDLVEKILPVLEKEGRLAGLVNLAGISIGDAIDHLADGDWDCSFRINATAPMRLCRAAIPYLEETKGAIVNVGSPVGAIGARKPTYAASKAALHGLTMSLARNLGPRGIRVNLLLPGACSTFLTSDWSEEKKRAVADGTFLKRLCRPEEIASVIFFLLGKEASYLTGSVIDMTAGGMWGH